MEEIQLVPRLVVVVAIRERVKSDEGEDDRSQKKDDPQNSRREIELSVRWA
jgi:hypothetical protein